VKEATNKNTDYPLEMELEIPLLENTESARNVAGLVHRVLGVISKTENGTSHHDIMQALTIVASVRLAMARSKAVRNKRMRLVPLDVAAV